MRLIVAVALAVGICVEPASILADESRTFHPLPRLDEKTPESARALLDWYALTYGEQMEGTGPCPPLGVLRLPVSFPRTEAIDALFREYGGRGGLWEAFAIHRLGTREERLALMESGSACVSFLALHSAGYELRALATSEGRDAGTETAAAIFDRLAASGYDQARANLRTPRLWGDYALVDGSSGDGKLVAVVLRWSADGWRDIGQMNTGIACGAPAK